MSAPTPPPRILIVDDDDGLRRTMKRALSISKPAKALGVVIEDFASGVEAVARCRVQAFDVAILDLQMPELDGVATAAELRKVSPDLKLLFVSGSLKSPLGEKARGLAPSAMLEKPFTAAAFNAMVESVLISVTGAKEPPSAPKPR